MSERLRFLMVTHTFWSRNLGASRVFMELAEELRELGDEVEKFSGEDAFPDAFRPRRSGRLATLAGYLETNRSFAARARAHLRVHGRRFDVVDAYQTDLPYPKRELGFSGLLVARSVGSISAYEAFEREAQRRWPDRSARRLIHGTLTLPGRLRHLRGVEPSFRSADLVNVSNSDDLAELGKAHGSRVVHFPFGLSRSRLAAFSAARAPVSERLAARTVAFIGTWNPRKGARDWPLVLQKLRGLVPDVRLLLLGTGIDPTHVRRDFPGDASLDVVSSYESDDLPRLLSRATVGAFPGYLEGFGFGVLEKLAAGLPTVAYDAPGVRDILSHLARPAMVPAGDTDALALGLAELLLATANRYAEQAEDSARVAATFLWPEIARRTREAYLEHLHRIRAEGGGPACAS